MGVPIEAALDEIYEGCTLLGVAPTTIHDLMQWFRRRHSQLSTAICGQKKRFIRLVVEEELSPGGLVEDPIWWDTPYLHDQSQLLLLVFPWEDWIASE